MNGYRRRPPLRRCPACGTDHYAWAEHSACAECSRLGREDRSALASMVREQRLARRERLGL